VSISSAERPSPRRGIVYMVLSAMVFVPFATASARLAASAITT
jgi:hypothetical protein